MRGVRKCVAVVLAAGESSRMGIPKALLEYEPGCTFLSQLISLFRAAGCEVVAVVGKDARAVRVAHPEATLIENTGWKDGQLTSARAGIRSALESGAQLLFIHPVDVPSVRRETVEALRSALYASGHPRTEDSAASDPTVGADAAIPVHQGKPGHPLILSRSAAERVLQMDVPHLEAAVQTLELLRIEVDDPGTVLSLNTPDEYRGAFGREPRAI